MPARQRCVPFGPLASLAIHLSPLLLLLSWSSTPVEIAAPIPVQLVLEQPPPLPPPPAPPPPPIPTPKTKELSSGRFASEDMGDVTKAEPGPRAEEPPKAEPEPPAETKMAALTPPSGPDLVSALPPPAPTLEPLPAPEDLKIPLAPEAAAAERRPPPPKRPAKEMASAWPLPLQPRSARAAGPEAIRDEYLAYCEALIRRFYGMLSPTFLGGRRGETTVTIMILPDGTIARIVITRSSGYPDIDNRIEEMVAAVRRFPPLPARFQGPGAVFRFHKAFP